MMKETLGGIDIDQGVEKIKIGKERMSIIEMIESIEIGKGIGVTLEIESILRRVVVVIRIEMDLILEIKREVIDEN